MATRKQWLLIGGGVLVVGGIVIYAATRPTAAASTPAYTAAASAPPAQLPSRGTNTTLRREAIAAQQAQAAADALAAQQAAQFAAAEAASNAASQAAGQPTPAPSGVTFALVISGNKSVQLKVGQTLGLQFLPCTGGWSQSATQQPAVAGNTVVQVMAPNILLATTEGQASFVFRCADGQAYSLNIEVISPTAGHLQG